MESVSIVNGLVEEESKLLGGTENVFIGGFSQGCALSLATFLTSKHKFGGVVGLSGALCLDIDWSNFDFASKKETPLFLYHGQNDSVVPEELAKLTYEIFTK